MSHTTNSSNSDDTYNNTLNLVRLMPINEVMITTGLGRSTIYKKIKEGTFPDSLKVSHGCVRWKNIDIDRWIRELKS